MSSAKKALGKDRSDRIDNNVFLPRRQSYYSSPVDWGDGRKK
jgi:hypothetical protein